MSTPIFNSVPSEYLDTYYGYMDVVAIKKRYNWKAKGFPIVRACRDHPVTFAYFMLGKTVRPYQAFAIDKILQNPQTALNWARRLGKSTICGLLAFWMTYFNKYPKNSFEKFTVVGIVSKEADASKKILRAIRELIDAGDVHWNKITAGQDYNEKYYFSRQLIEPNNSEQITWSNKSSTHSLPPTKKVKGWGFSYLFIDEISYLAPKDEPADSFYSLTCRPTLAECGGKLCIASTPAGRSGLYYELFDPDDKFDTDFVRLWFNWEIADGDTNEELIYRQFVNTERKRLMSTGKEAVYRQEFMGDFTVVQSSFYDLEDIEIYFDNNIISQYEWHKSPCSIGIDFGISNCLTVVTVKTKYRGKIITLYQRHFPQGFDNNELMNGNNDDSIPRLVKRYDVQWLVPEESSVSDMFVRWCKREGYPVFPYRFSTGNIGSKNSAYHTHRSMLKKGVMVSYPLALLKEEMQTLQEKQEKINWIISKPPGGTDDCIDSDVFSTIPFFDDDGSGWHGISNDYSEFEAKVEVKHIDTSSINVRRDTGFSRSCVGGIGNGFINPPI